MMKNSTAPLGRDFTHDQNVRSLAVPMAVGRVVFPNRVFLAPLSGITDVPFRRLARGFGAGMVVSEMVASGELLRGTSESRKRAMADGEGLHVVQLAGRDPAVMRDAARLLSDGGADVIDINFGCPAKKVVGGLSGSALMREPDLALRIVDAVVEGAAGVPVSAKMRLGWDEDSLNADDIARRAESAGVSMVTVHGRTRQQFYEGSADWPAIARIKQAIDLPMVANGDLVAPEQASRMLRESGADALMIGRGACGRPWFPGLLAGATSIAELGRLSLADLAASHYEAMLSHYGAVAGVRHARKHLGWYLDRVGAFVDEALVRPKADLLREGEPARVLATLRSIFDGLTPADLETAAPAARQQAA